jgi:hypothetical protein
MGEMGILDVEKLYSATPCKNTSSMDEWWQVNNTTKIAKLGEFAI